MNAKSRSTQPGCRVESTRAKGGTNALASRFRNAWRVTLLATLASFATGCESTGDTTPVTVVPTPRTAQTAVLAESVTVTNDPSTNAQAGTNTLTGTNLPPEAVADVTNNQQVTVIQTEPPKIAPPEGVKVTPAIEAILKMVQAGVGEEAIIAYVNKNPADYSLDADTIVYLTDLGITTPVIAVMLNNDTGLDPSEKETLAKTAVAEAPEPAPPAERAAEAQQQPSVAQQPQLGNGYVAAPAHPGAPTEVAAPQQQVVVVQQPQVVYTTPPAEVVQNYFYTPLQPYGSWVYVGSYGWCWRPTVAVYDSSWRPYHSQGRWIWSNHGWYWQSDYSWGWAPFHYGRWTCPTGVGWVWSPDYTWGPARVSWRRSDAYCGWAPLPPRAHWRSGFGFSYYDRHVGISFDFGLSHHHYTFLRARDFCDPHPWRRSLRHHETANVYNNSTVVNNYINGNNNTIINNGVGHDFIAANTRSEIRKVNVRERADIPVGTRPGRGTAIAPDRVTKVGNEMVVYRPTPPPVTPASQTTAASGLAVGNRGEPVRGMTPTARLNSRTIDRVNSDIASRPNSTLVRPTRRPDAVATPRSDDNSTPGFATRPSPVPGTLNAPTGRNAEPRREPITSALRTEPSTRIGSGLMSDQATRPGSRPGSIAPSTPGGITATPSTRPGAAPGASQSDQLSQRLREVRREGINARVPQTSSADVTARNSIGSQPNAARVRPETAPIGRNPTPSIRPGIVPPSSASTPSITRPSMSRPSAPPNTETRSMAEVQASRRIAPIRNPAPTQQTPSVSSAPGSSSFPTARPRAPFASNGGQDQSRNEMRAMSPRFNNGARGNPSPAPSEIARPQTAPAPIVSQPVTPYRSTPIERPSYRQQSGQDSSPRFSAPPQNNPAPMIRQAPPVSQPQQIPSYRTAPMQSQPTPQYRPRAPIQSQPAPQYRQSAPIQSAPAPSRPSFENRPSPSPSPGPRSYSPGGGGRVPIDRENRR